MEQHVKTIAILNIIFAGLALLGSLVILLVFGGMAGVIVQDNDPDAASVAAMMGAIGGIAAVAMAIFAVPALIGAIGLLKYKEWARVLTIVMSAINLLGFPFGTALGVYGIWALTKDETRALFKTQNI